MAVKFIECFYGQSGTGKSESAAAIAKAIYRETKKTARILIGDGSAATYVALEDAGVAKVFDYTTRDWPLSTLHYLCRGFWPKDVQDPQSPFIPMTKEEFESIGIYIIEGLSVASNYVMGDKKGGLAYRAARGEKIGQDTNIQITDAERDAAGNIIKNSGPGTQFGGNPLSHYGVAQRRMLGFLEESKSLPGWVIWTAHERSAEDKVSGAKLIGPEVAGGALTSSLPRYFNNTLHFSTAEKTVKKKDDHTEKMVDVIDAEYRVYTRDHFRAEGNSYTKYKAVTRHSDPDGKVYGVKLPLYFEDGTPGASILKFYENLKELRLKVKESLAA